MPLNYYQILGYQKTGKKLSHHRLLYPTDMELVRLPQLSSLAQGRLA